MKVETYIARPDVDNMDNMVNKPHEYFFNINDQNEVNNYIVNLDSVYLEGAIVLQYGEIVIMDYGLWDSVNMTWAAFINALDNYSRNDQCAFSLPDQNIVLEIKKIDHAFLSLKIGEGKYGDFELPSYEFMMVVLEGAEQFFKWYDEHFTVGKYLVHQNQIRSIKKILERSI